MDDETDALCRLRECLDVLVVLDRLESRGGGQAERLCLRGLRRRVEQRLAEESNSSSSSAGEDGGKGEGSSSRGLGRSKMRIPKFVSVKKGFGVQTLSAEQLSEVERMNKTQAAPVLNWGELANTRLVGPAKIADDVMDVDADEVAFQILNPNLKPKSVSAMQQQSWQKNNSNNNNNNANKRPAAFVSARSRLGMGDETWANESAAAQDADLSVEMDEGGFKRPRPFKPPTRSGSSNGTMAQGTKPSTNQKTKDDQQPTHPRYKNIDPALIERIENEVLDSSESLTFADIAGLDFAKQCIEEMVIWPIRNPEYYTGLRQLPKGLLLFGPPGTGKTLIGKTIASECNATFFSISASSLTSKWIGEGEKTVRALFAVAAVKSPSVVFIDEIDSLLTQRSSEENEASRRIKTEFLVQLDGAGTKNDEMVLVIGATNRPQELDEAARRRFVKRLYIPLPDDVTRSHLLFNLLKKNDHELSEKDIEDLTARTKGYSGADITNLAREASMGPLREILRGGGKSNNSTSEKPKLRPIVYKDFLRALSSIRASVSDTDLAMYRDWDDKFGTRLYVGNSSSSTMSLETEETNSNNQI